MKIITNITYALLCIILLSTVSCSVKDNPDGDVVSVGESVPEGFGLPIDGVSFIAFFNASCPDCIKEMPVIVELYDKYGGDVSFLMIGRGMSVQEIKDFYDKNDYYIPFQADPNRKIFDTFGGTCIPLCFLCKDGIVKYIWGDKPIMTVKDFEKSFNKL